MDDEDVPIFRLLLPDIMTNDELVTVLQRYKLRLDLTAISRDELIEIYKRIALPLPQRTNGTTWRERLLAKKQNRKRISFVKDSSMLTSVSIKSATSESSAGRLLSLTSPSQRDRLKPPVNPASHKKIILLSTSAKNGDSACGKVSNDNAHEGTSSEKNSCDIPQLEKHKRIRIDFSDSTEKSTPVPKLVRRLSEDKVVTQPVSKHRRIVI